MQRQNFVTNERFLSKEALLCWCLCVMCMCNVYCAAYVWVCNIYLQQSNSSINSQTICGRRTLFVNSCSCLSTFMCALCTMHYYHVFVPIEGKTIAKHSFCMYFYNNITCGVIIALRLSAIQFSEIQMKDEIKWNDESRSFVS